MLAAQLLVLGKMRVEGEGASLGQALAAAVPLMYTRLSEMMGREEMEVVKAVLEVRRGGWGCPDARTAVESFFSFFLFFSVDIFRVLLKCLNNIWKP